MAEKRRTSFMDVPLDFKKSFLKNYLKGYIELKRIQVIFYEIVALFLAFHRNMTTADCHLI